MIGLNVLKYNQANLLGRGSSMFLPVFDAVRFWDVVAEAGKPATVLRWPLTFPAGAEKARVLSGLGTPDLRGGLGNHTFYSDSQDLIERGTERRTPSGRVERRPGQLRGPGAQSRFDR